MPTPPFQITVTPKGNTDFYANLIQPNYPNEFFESGKDGMSQAISALAQRARYSQLEPIVIGSLIRDTVIPLATWTNIDLSANIEVNRGNWFDGLLFQPTVAGYYRFNIKMVALEIDPGENVAIRITVNDASTVAQNQFYNYFTLNQIDFFEIYLTHFVLLNGTTDFARIEINPSQNTEIVASPTTTSDNFFEITTL